VGSVVVSHLSGRRRGGVVASVGEQQGVPVEEEPGALNLRVVGRCGRGGDPRGGSTAALIWVHDVMPDLGPDVAYHTRVSQIV
jgi:hypothetical protein